MAVGPTLGTGLFIGAGQALAVGGPASLLVSYLFLSALVYCLATAVAEIAAHMPLRDGTMLTHGYRYASTHLGFSMSYLRWYSLSMLIPFEITNAIVSLGLVKPSPAVVLRVSIPAAIIFGFNMLPERMFQRSQAAFTHLKLITSSGLVLLSIVFAIPGVPHSPVRGFQYWNNPGPMNEFVYSGHLGRFLGLLQCLLYSTIAFSFAPELIVQRAEQLDSENQANVLSVARTDMIQLLALYILNALAMGVMSPSTDPSLTNHGIGAGASPYLVAIKAIGIPVLPVVVTVLIFLSSVASGRSFLFTSSRLLCSLAEAGHAPELFQRRNRWGVPYMAVITSALFANFAYLSVIISSSVVFNSLMQFITTSGYISWIGSCIVYLHFRRQTEGLGFTSVHRARIQPYGAYVAIASCTVLPVANAFILATPSQLTASKLVPLYIGISSFFLLYYGHHVGSFLAQKKTKVKESVVEEPGDWAIELSPQPPTVEPGTWAMSET
ncbi:putative proline permease [Aspergillus clavatus NRRL 1]|uniref:Proline permease, putative n=1 Tax=Aspergillus clavatus (strain ATCC 1007 / CBS 513.65 / DSM 816 / NCTC 3887 / NRRL 1 / QM 1276 / 107) TaxID=344612 RepID=A1C6G6_ASPCL|nr:proline permease, putative [Aspergillus clavatus NRRL 1]EAW13987.1 proline permease, putative [Aspergillus clavatus NRRL 1]